LRAARADFRILLDKTMASYIRLMEKLSTKKRFHVPDMALAHRLHAALVRGGDPGVALLQQSTRVYRTDWRDLEMGENIIRVYPKTQGKELRVLVGLSHLVGIHKHLLRLLHEQRIDGIQIVLDTSTLEHPAVKKAAERNDYLRQ